MKTLLKTLCDASGAAGYTAVIDTLKTLVQPLADDMHVDALGSLLAVRRCGRDNAPLLLLEAHVDEIGFVVTRVDDDGFVHVANCGGIDRRVLAASEVVLLGEREVSGVFCSTPPHLSDGDDKLRPLDEMGIDVGLPAEKVKRLIPVGTRGVFRANFAALSDHLVTSKALDDRAGCAAVVRAMQLLKEETLSCDVAALFAVQEEIGGGGATVAAFSVEPTAAIVTDVSFAKTPDAPAHKCGELGKGAMLGVAPGLAQAWTAQLLALANAHDIPFQYEVMGATTGTDADSIAYTRSGVPTALLSIPQRYMHTPVEVVDVRDVEAVAAWMATAAKEATF
ncbi:MAG: M20/M25/M40 family metallo-hydrolase [Clostridia bacterium]|nr:M20/M25/M40 family metallo-hydrolase [Clostridia bacterium]